MQMKSVKGVDMQKINLQQVNRVPRVPKWFLLVPMVLALSACGHLSQGINDKGTAASELIWPTAADTNRMSEDGSYPTPEAVSLLSPGLSKEQVQRLIGAPHFSEGIAGVREWDYLFHLRNKDGRTLRICQLKLLFAQDGTVGSLYWLPEGCALNGDRPAPAPLEARAPTVFTLKAHALFAFDSAVLDDLKTEGLQELEALATQLREKNSEVKNVVITGYSDRLGSADYNRDLSTRRAHSVAQYLIQHGIPSSRIQAIGRGAGDPVTTDCPNTLARAALIDCLEPDRRVEVQVNWLPVDSSNQALRAENGSAP